MLATPTLPTRLPLWTGPVPPLGPMTSAQRRGLAYERKVGRWLRNQHLGGTLHDHPWLVGPCQPDFVVEYSGCFLIIEVKLTQCDCERQFRKYSRILPNSTCIQICRRVTSPSTCPSILDAIDRGTVLLWL